MCVCVNLVFPSPCPLPHILSHTTIRNSPLEVTHYTHSKRDTVMQTLRFNSKIKRNKGSLSSPDPAFSTWSTAKFLLHSRLGAIPLTSWAQCQEWVFSFWRLICPSNDLTEPERNGVFINFLHILAIWNKKDVCSLVEIATFFSVKAG